MKYKYNVVSGIIIASGLVAFAATAQQQSPAQIPTEYTIKLTPAELDLIGNGLGSIQFKDAAPLINKLREQVLEQKPKPDKVEDKK